MVIWVLVGNPNPLIKHLADLRSQFGRVTTLIQLLRRHAAQTKPCQAMPPLASSLIAAKHASSSKQRDALSEAASLINELLQSGRHGPGHLGHHQLLQDLECVVKISRSRHRLRDNAVANL